MCLLSAGEAEEGRAARLYFQMDDTAVMAFEGSTMFLEHWPDFKEQLGVELVPAFCRLWNCTEAELDEA